LQAHLAHDTLLHMFVVDIGSIRSDGIVMHGLYDWLAVV